MKKLPIGTRIRFLKTLTLDANEDHPALIFATQGELGEVTAHNCKEGHWVKTDAWPNAFGAELGTEFEPTEKTLWL